MCSVFFFFPRSGHLLGAQWKKLKNSQKPLCVGKKLKKRKKKKKKKSDKVSFQLAIAIETHTSSSMRRQCQRRKSIEKKLKNHFSRQICAKHKSGVVKPETENGGHLEIFATQCGKIKKNTLFEFFSITLSRIVPEIMWKPKVAAIIDFLKKKKKFYFCHLGHFWSEIFFSRTKLPRYSYNRSGHHLGFLENNFFCISRFGTLLAQKLFLSPTTSKNGV
jgi:hypothetical protein